MSGRPENVDPAGADLHDEQDIQSLQEDRVEVEEVAGQQPVSLGGQEGPPRGVRLPRRRAERAGPQDPPHGRLAESVAQTDELAVHPAVAPPGVFSGEPVDPARGSGCSPVDDLAGSGSATCAPRGAGARPAAWLV